MTLHHIRDRKIESRDRTGQEREREIETGRGKMDRE